MAKAPSAPGVPVAAGPADAGAVSAPPFLAMPRRHDVYRDVQTRLGDWREVEPPVPEADTRGQAERCMGCGLPFCHAHGCPLGNLIPDTNRCLREGRWR